MILIESSESTTVLDNDDGIDRMTAVNDLFQLQYTPNITLWVSACVIRKRGKERMTSV